MKTELEKGSADYIWEGAHCERLIRATTRKKWVTRSKKKLYFSSDIDRDEYSFIIFLKTVEKVMEKEREREYRLDDLK